jgi:hypothetical protein
MFEGWERARPDHTSFSGQGRQHFRSLPATEFSRIDVMAELHSDLCGQVRTGHLWQRSSSGDRPVAQGAQGRVIQNSCRLRTT